MNDISKSTGDKALESLRLALQAVKQVEGGSPDAMNAATARNVLHEELGYFGPPERQPYLLSEETKDTLLVHARQDASHAVMNASVAMAQASRAVRAVGLLALVLIVCTGAVLFAIYSTR